MNVHLVDGTYELFRAYFGGPPATNKADQEVGAVRTLARSLLYLLREPEVTHVGVAYDHVIRSFRNDLYDGYKTEEGVAAELLSQFDLAEQMTEAIGVRIWSMIEFEADDAIATMARIAAADPRVERVVLCSPDKDLAQCVVGERIVMRDRMRKTTLDEAGVTAKFGVPPRSIADYLALVGDTADGIPGIPGFGAKSAAAVLAAYGSVEAIPARASDWSVKVRGADRLAANLEAEREHALLYKKLATLRFDVPVGTTVDDLEWRGPNAADLADLVDDLDDASLTERVHSVAQERGKG